MTTLSALISRGSLRTETLAAVGVVRTVHSIIIAVTCCHCDSVTGIPLRPWLPWQRRDSGFVLAAHAIFLSACQKQRSCGTQL